MVGVGLLYETSDNLALVWVIGVDFTWLTAIDFLDEFCKKVNLAELDLYGWYSD